MAPAEPAHVDGASDPRLADFRRLNDTAFRRTVETATSFDRGFFVTEGWLGLERLLDSHHEVRRVLVADNRLDRLAALRGLPLERVLVAPQRVVDAVVGFSLHRGVVASATRPRPRLTQHVIGRSRRLVVVEGVNDAENLGTLFRNAAALGADGALLDPTCCDPLTRRTIRVSMGPVLGVEWARAAWPETLVTLREQGFEVVALSPSPDAAPIDQIEVAPGRPIAVMVGAEGPGLSQLALDGATIIARIPMARGIDSLNVGAAAAIAFHRLFASEPR